MGEVKWIKVSTDMFNNNRKIKQIEVMPEGDAILVIWLKLLLLAGNINDGGAIYLTPEIPYTDETLANELRKPITTVRLALSVFEKYGMIEIVDDILMLSAWEKYQSVDRLAEIRAKTRERVARCRENKRLEACNVTSNATVTLGNAVEEEEGEEDSEGDFHSFTHSNAREDESNVEPVENSFDRDRAKRTIFGGTLGKGVVMLSEEQFDNLLDELSIDEINKYMSIVADCELNGKPYTKKTHYQAILDMARKDRKVKNRKTN